MTLKFLHPIILLSCLVWGISSLASFGHLAAQTADTVVALENLQPILLNNNPDIIALRRDVTKNYLEYQNSRSMHQPSLFFRGAAERFLKQDGTLGYQAFTGPRLAWTLYDGGKIRLNKKLSHESLDSTELELRKVRLQAITKLKDLISHAAYWRSVRDLAQGFIALAEENLKYVQLNYRSGKMYRYQVYDAEENLASQELLKLQAENELANIQRDLSLTLGSSFDDMPDLKVSPIKPPAIDPDFTAQFSDLESLVDQSPALDQSQNEKVQSSLKIRLQNAKRKPRVELRTDFVVIRNDSTPFIPFFFTGVTFNMPMYEAGRINRSTEIAEIDAEKSQSSLGQTRQSLLSEVRQLLDDYTYKQAELKVANLRLKSDADRLRMDEDRFRSGFTSYPVVYRHKYSVLGQKRNISSKERDIRILKHKIEDKLGLE